MAEAIRSETGLQTRDVLLLHWIQRRSKPVFCAEVARDYYGARDFIRDNFRFREAKDQMESLALNGYLRRGRSRGKSSQDGTKFAVTNYRLTQRATNYLRHHGPQSGETTSV